MSPPCSVLENASALLLLWAEVSLPGIHNEAGGTGLAAAAGVCLVRLKPAS